MADLFDRFNIEQPSEPTQEQEQDLFSQFNVQPQSIQEQNINALNSGTDLTPEQVKYQEQDSSQWQKVAESRFSQDQLDSWKDSPIGFWEAKDFLEVNQVVPLGGLSQGYEAGKLFLIGQKYENGEALSESEQTTFNSYIDKVTEMKLRGFSVGGMVTYYGAQAPAFMAEFALSGGAGKLAQKATTKGVAVLAQKTAVKGALASTTKSIAGTTANVTARTMAMPSMVARGIGERALSDTINVTDKGEVLLKQYDESPTKTILMAQAYTSAEVASEMSGSSIGKYVISPVVAGATKVLKTPLVAGINNLSPRLQQIIYKGYQSTKPNTKVSKVLSSVGWNGMLEEMGEEEINRVITAGIGLVAEDSYTLEDAQAEIQSSLDERLATAGIVGVFGSVSTGANIVSNKLQEKGFTKEQADESVQMMTQEELDNKVLEDYPLPSSEYNTSSELRGTETNEFKEWFGDSKVVDEQGKPLTVYHGTDAEFTEFSKDLIGTNFELDEVGIFFTDDKDSANSYRKSYPQKPKYAMTEEDKIATTSGRVIEVYVDIKKPVILSDIKDIDLTPVRASSVYDINRDKIVKAVEDQQADGVIIKREGEKFIMALDPSQIIFKNNVDNLVESVPLSVSADVVNEQIKSINQTDPAPVRNEESTFNKVMTGFNEYKTKAKEGFNTFYSEWFDDMSEIQKVSDSVTYSNEEASLIDRVRIRSTIAERVKYKLEIEAYKFDELGNAQVTGKSMKSIIDDFDNTVLDVEPSREVREQDFNDFLITNRVNQDLAEKGKATETEITNAIARTAELQQKYGDKFSWFNMYADELLEFQRNELSQLVDSGIMSQKSYDSLVKEHPNYVPFYRIMEEDESGYADLITGKGRYTNQDAKKVIKQIKGSDREINNVFENIIKNVGNYTDMAEKNIIARQTVDIAAGMGRAEKIKTPMEKIVVDGKDVYRPSKVIPKDAVVVYREGKKEFYRVDKPLLEAMTKIDPIMYSLMDKIFSTSRNLVRGGATLTPDFIARNFARDIHISIFQSKNKSKSLTSDNMVLDAAKGIANSFNKDGLYRDWVKAGGKLGSYMELDEQGLGNVYKEMFKKQGRLGKIIKSPYTLLSRGGEISEQANRIGEFKRAKAQGKSDIQAAAESLEVSLNFARAGSKGRKVNRYVPFFNAGMQSTDKLIRTLKENPKESAMWGTATITLPSLMIQGYYLFAAPDDERQEYLEIPQWQKDIFWTFKVGDTWVRYPKPFAYGYLFGTVPERMMQWGYDNDDPRAKETWTDIVKGSLGSVVPVSDASALLPPAIKLGIETATNYNFFTGRDIYPEWLSRLKPEDRANKYTSETSKIIGKELGVSPAVLDNLVRGQLASAGAYGLQASDAIMKAVKEYNGETIAEKPVTKSDLPLIKAFVVRNPEGYRSVSAGRLFEKFNTISQTNASYNKRKGKERSEYLKNNRGLIMAYKPVKSYVNQMKAIQEQVNAVYDNKSMSSQQKVDRISKLEKQITKIARQGVKYINEQVDSSKLK